MSDAAGTAEDPAREAYVVIHVTDLYKLGVMRPEQFDIAYEGFPWKATCTA